MSVKVTLLLYVAAEQCENAIGLKALTNEVAIEALELAVVSNVLPAAQAFLKG